MSEYAFDAPAQIGAGLVHVRLVNRGADIHESLLVRFTGSAASAGAYVDRRSLPSENRLVQVKSRAYSQMTEDRFERVNRKR